MEEERCHRLACLWAAKAIIDNNSARVMAQEVLAAYNATTPLATMTAWLALEEAAEEETTIFWIRIFKAQASAWDPLEAT